MAQPVTSSASFQPETRVQQSVLTALEKRVLHWLAVRMPAGINSDHLTLLALFAMVSVGASYWLSRYTPIGLVLATVWLAVNWFGDSLDGTLARVRGQQRPRYGYYVDHVVDVVGVLFLFAGLGLSGYLHPGVAAALLMAYFLLSLEIYLATHSLADELLRRRAHRASARPGRHERRPARVRSGAHPWDTADRAGCGSDRRRGCTGGHLHPLCPSQHQRALSRGTDASQTDSVSGHRRAWPRLP